MDSELEKLVSSGKLASGVAEKIDALKPGTFCRHKSWGAGEVAEWDLVGGQLKIDFEGRPGHGMKLEFAAKSLEAIDPDHILAQRAGNLEVVQKLAEDDPVVLIRKTLESFGRSMTLDQLDDALKGSIVPEGRYKSWWDSTKKKLKKDKTFVVPSRRTEPLELRASGMTPAEALLEDFRSSRDLKDKAKAAASILEHLDEFKGAEADLKAVLAEIDESGTKAVKMHPLRVVELLAVRDEMLTLKPDLAVEGSSGLTLADLIVTEEAQLGHILSALPVTRVRLLLASFPEAFGDDWADRTLALLGKVGSRGVAEIARFLIEQGETEKLNEFLRRGVRHRDLSPDTLVWICKERQGAAVDVMDDELPVAIMNSLEKSHMDEGARRSNRLHDLLYSDRELLADMVRDMDVNHVRTFARRLLMTPVFEELNRRSLLARVIKVHPEVQELVTGEEDDKKKKQPLVVSWESLQRKQADLEELNQKKIPENRKEIAIAREHGDLRENFEFKAAKQMQAVLMRQKREWEKDISEAQGTDFADVDISAAAIGTIVDLEDTQSGEKLTYTILGAWDSDPDKGIVAYVSEVGKSIVGTKPGEEVELPPAEENAPPRVYKVLEVRRFTQGQPA